MLSPVPTIFRPCLYLLSVCVLLTSVSCGTRVVKPTEAEPRIATNSPATPTSVSMWLGNTERNFYGSGP